MTHKGGRPVRIVWHRKKDSVICAGVLDLKQAQEWVVTTKLGASDKRPGTQVCPQSCSKSLSFAVPPDELYMGMCWPCSRGMCLATLFSAIPG